MNNTHQRAIQRARAATVLSQRDSQRSGTVLPGIVARGMGQEESDRVLARSVLLSSPNARLAVPILATDPSLVRAPQQAMAVAEPHKRTGTGEGWGPRVGVQRYERMKYTCTWGNEQRRQEEEWRPVMRKARNCKSVQIDWPKLTGGTPCWGRSPRRQSGGRGEDATSLT
ncbi:hypothetical protein L211DRAFT_834448 [Terfezia boudieri ATCC MYA-4762]|uniref:Uncharacterized protein n=1 Tax=Terfezia boudieri ATCC MYA-4762 TaxID=1051890 RepID=A0A3N4LXK1_9PEZI|nr:hypothetical protein L211DRAFT_834448 [Terfezia boudieri ATCC MYA-4762]